MWVSVHFRIALVSLLILCATVHAQTPTEPLVELAKRLTADQPSPPSPPSPPEVLARASNESLPLGPSASSDAPATVSPATGPASGGEWLFRTTAALAAVLALIFLCRALLRRFGGQVIVAARHGAVEVMSRHAVAPRCHVLVLRVGGRILLVGESPGGLRTLCDITDPEEVAAVLAAVSTSSPRSLSRSFSEMVHQFSDEDGQASDQAPGLCVDRARGQVAGLRARLRALGVGGPRA